MSNTCELHEHVLEMTNLVAQLLEMNVDEFFRQNCPELFILVY